MIYFPCEMTNRLAPRIPLGLCLQLLSVSPKVSERRVLTCLSSWIFALDRSDQTQSQTKLE